MHTPDHLGGHGGITHIDEGVLDWAIDILNPKTAYDIGCGTGDMVKHMLDKGIDATGIEGDPALNWGRPEKFIRHDFTQGPLNLGHPVDLGWAVEFLEHIDEEYLDNVFSVFRDCRYVIVTAAPPGTEEAHHHVNCQPTKYWKRVFREHGFRYKVNHTSAIRERSTMGREFMRETGIVFENTRFDHEK